MKHSIKFGLMGGMILFCLSMSLTSCEDILGEWSKPTPATAGGGSAVSVTGITLDPTTLSMKVGDADVTLTATVTPDNATDKAVTWGSDNEAAATVTNGVVHAVGEGTATITAKAGDQTATCTVTVKVPYTAQEYKKRSWNGTKVDSVKQTATSPTEIANDYTGTIASGWYTVTGDNVVISGDQTLTDDTYLILCDGAKLTITGQINGRTHNKSLYIYGQEEGTGQLVVTNSTFAIYGSNSSGTIEIHGGVITATSTSATGLYYYGITMYGGKLNATGSMAGIGFDSGNFDLYGGEVVAEATTMLGIATGGGATLTVYGGKVQATGGTGYQAILANIKSGTSGIKFYFSTDGTTDWDSGNSYNGTAAPNKRYAKVE